MKKYWIYKSQLEIDTGVVALQDLLICEFFNDV